MLGVYMVVRRAIIFTAISKEFVAARSFLDDVRKDTRGDSINEIGYFEDHGNRWEIVLVETGKNNPNAASKTTKAIIDYNPCLIMFVGVAGGLKDLDLGDVVAADFVVGYENGKVEKTFQPRSDSFRPDSHMVDNARYLVRNPSWLKRIPNNNGKTPKALVGAIASGEKVLANSKSDLCKYIKENYSQTLAIEMEGLGFLNAAYNTSNKYSIVIRGISDLLDKKGDYDASGWQEIAAKNACAFAYELISQFDKSKCPPEEVSQDNPTTQDITIICAGIDNKFNLHKLGTIVGENYVIDVSKIRIHPLQYPSDTEKFPLGENIFPLKKDWTLSDNEERYSLLVKNNGKKSVSNIIVHVDSMPFIIKKIALNNHVVNILRGGENSTWVYFEISNLHPGTSQQMTLLISGKKINKIDAWTETQHFKKIYVYNYVIVTESDDNNPDYIKVNLTDIRGYNNVTY